MLITYPIQLGPMYAGKALTAQLVDTTGAAVGDEITTGFAELDNGFYLWTVEIADAFQGGVTIHEVGFPETILTGTAVQPLATAAALEALKTHGNAAWATADVSALATAASIAALNNLSAAQVNAEVIDVLRTDTIPDSYAAKGAQPTIAQAILAIHQYLQERSVSGTTVTVRKPDGSATAMTFTLDDADNPTSQTRAMEQILF